MARSYRGGADLDCVFLRLKLGTSEKFSRKLFEYDARRALSGRVLIAPAAIYVQVTGIEIMPEARNSHPMQ